MKLADKYIVRSDGSIQTVLDLAIGYRKSKKATLAVWHPLEGSDASGKFLMTKAVVSEVCQKPKTFNYILLIKRRNSDRTMVPKSMTSHCEFNSSIWYYPRLASLWMY